MSYICYGPANSLYVLKTIYSWKVVLGMIDQCNSETDIINYILPYIIVIYFNIFHSYEMAPAGSNRDPLGSCSSYFLSYGSLNIDNNSFCTFSNHALHWCEV